MLIFRIELAVGKKTTIGKRTPRDGKVMSKEDEYRRSAAESLELAARAASSRDKWRLLALAEKWLDLAERAHTLALNRVGRIRPVHPLVRAKIPDQASDLP